MNVKIMRLYPDAVIPQYALDGDTGFDLVAAADVIIEPGETALVTTGIAIELPPGYELQVRPRSGITLRTKLRVQLGTVDSNYRGEIGVIVDNAIKRSWWRKIFTHLPLNINNERGGQETPHSYYYGSYIIRKGDRIAQGVIAPVAAANFVEVDKLGDSERGPNGFGSTGVRNK